MNTYIPADKLLAEIERRKNQSERRLNNIVPIRRKDTMDEEQLAKFELRDKVDRAYLNGVLVTLSDILSFITSLQQEQPEVELEKDAVSYCYDNGINISPRQAKKIACHFYNPRNAALEKAAQHAYESWMGGTMDDVRRNMVELGKVLNAKKED